MILSLEDVVKAFRSRVGDPSFSGLLKRFLAIELPGKFSDHLSDEELVALAAERILPSLNRGHSPFGRSHTAHELYYACPELHYRRRFHAGGWKTVPYEPEPEPEPVQTREPDWVAFRIVKDRSGEPVGGVTLKIERPDGVAGRETSLASGKIEIELDEGGPSVASSDLSRATLGGTLRVVGMGESPIEAEERDELVKQAEALPGFWPGGDLRLAHVEAHQVTRGDTRAALAERAGMSWLDLAEFNFGTRDPDRIERCLEVFVGCTRKTEDGRELVFDDADKPGQIFIPAPWKKDQLGEKQVHTIRVRPVIPKLHLWYQIDLDDPDTHNDSVILRAADRSFELRLALGGLEEVKPNYVELIFPRPPDGLKYDVLQDPGDGKDLLYIFRDITNEDLLCSRPELLVMCKSAGDGGAKE